MDWLDEALCKRLHPDFWFPPLDASSPNPYYAVGKYVCNGCPVWHECLTYCDDNEDSWGLWGGLSPQERKRRHALPHGTIEARRGGCHCDACLSTPDWSECQPDLYAVPRQGDDYDLMSVIFDITSNKD